MLREKFPIAIGLQQSFLAEANDFVRTVEHFLALDRYDSDQLLDVLKAVVGEFWSYISPQVEKAPPTLWFGQVLCAERLQYGDFSKRLNDIPVKKLGPVGR